MPKKPYTPPSLTELAPNEVAGFLLAEDKPNPHIIDLTKRSAMPSERGIYELPANRAGEHPLYALDSNGFIVGWDRYGDIMDLAAAVGRLKKILEDMDPLVKTA